MKLLSIAVLASMALLTVSCNDPKFLKTIPVQEPNLEALSDGVYHGSYALPLPAGYFIGNPAADVAVTLSNHRYQAVEITGKLQPIVIKSMDPLLKRIVAEQKLNLDGLSGASYTMRAVQKAVENALTGK